MEQAVALEEMVEQQKEQEALREVDKEMFLAPPEIKSVLFCLEVALGI